MTLVLASAFLGVWVPAHGQDYRVAPINGEAMIVNTGSTNTTGYRVFVRPSGNVRVVLDPKPSDWKEPWAFERIPREQARQLFRDLAIAPLSALPAGHGLKSASFGTSTYVVFGGQRSPDLSFPANAQARALAHDISAISATLNLKTGPRHPAGPMTPTLTGH